MGERNGYAPGTFCWVELGTTDARAARAFYEGLLGWEPEETEAPQGGTYVYERVGGKRVAGLYERLGDALGPPAWTSYVAADDAGVVSRKASALGGKVVAEPFDVVGGGKIALLEDPQGAAFGVWQAGAHVGAELVNDPGALSLNQLNAADPAVAREFYTKLFGWRVETAVEEPPYWGIFNGKGLNGGMMQLPPGGGQPHWLAYFTSADLDRATARTGELGGAVLVPATAIASGRILVAADPRGASFALFEGQVDP